MTLGRELLLGGQFGLELGNARMLGLDCLALVADFALALLELGLELGKLRVAFVEGGRPAGESLLGVEPRFEDFLLLGESGLQLLLSRA